MRRSKSNPAKYTRNYKKISQRHMTGYVSSIDSTKNGKSSKSEDVEQKRLEEILKQSELTWKRGLAENGHSVSNDDNSGGDTADKKKRSASTTNQALEDNKEEDDNDMLSLLSPELQAQFTGMSGDNLLILPSKKKKSNKKKELPPLTPAEIKAAKSLYKNTQRKLQQLAQRKLQKEQRSTLYKQLESNKVSDNNRSLLLKSSELGKKLTKKEYLKQLHKKELLGIKLTNDEMDVLYDTHDAPPTGTTTDELTNIKTAVGNGKDVEGDVDAKELVGIKAVLESKKRSKKKKKKKRKSLDIDGEQQNGIDVDVKQGKEKAVVAKKARLDTGDAEKKKVDSSATSSKIDEKQEDTPAVSSTPTTDDNTETTSTTTKPIDYSSMMLASISSLKTKTDTSNEQIATEKLKKHKQQQEEIAKLEEEERKKRKVYVPTETVTVSSTVLGLGSGVDQSTSSSAKNSTSKLKKHTRVVQTINRPLEVQESRYNLPVSTMEYEIIDAIRSNDCTILCGETGSGKSTQVPQFLYEAGFSQKQQQQQQQSGGGDATPSSANKEDDHLLIGITQPRRVAAVSTAKRVAYEMGCGSGQSIPPNNLISYQTRYETAGLGTSTQIKFMTDGILLQEIQSDLLLRKYGAIIIDEESTALAHERNLNTDVLLGLLSVALPMRRKASEEGSLPPLKLVVMSATLKVEDFTNNKRLFPRVEDKPALVTVPGRTYPVSIHHSKITELDDYEKVATEKICKIHRKLPAGGILVFLTGKQEIVRCVNRLRQRLEPGRGKKKMSGRPSSREEGNNGDDVHQTVESETLDGGIRDMDDDEVDGDLFQKEEEDDFDQLENEEDVDIGSTSNTDNDDDDKRPKKVRILPLYSMLSVDEQAKVFAPVPDDTRLIVVATNIAETSITIPGISYVVDSGRQKCRNYHAGTGVASYDVMWISKAAADQRAGRAGRTGPGHCYRLYSSSVYSRYLDDFALPEVLTRPLEDVVLAMKAMDVSNVTSFPFPTPPEQGQINAAIRLLANLGCVDVSRVEEQGGDGKITSLGQAVAKLPLGVRYGKMLLVAAQANVLDYAIALVAVLSESTPFVHHTEEVDKEDDKSDPKDEDLDEIDQNQVTRKEKELKKEMKSKWNHDGGDVLAALKAVGAYAYAGRGAGGSSEKLACRQFCEENGLHLVVMQRIAKMRLHLCKLAKGRLPHAGGVAAETGKYLPSMPPPKRLQEGLLRQAIASGLLDNVARRAPPGAIGQEFSGIPRSAYICGNSKLKEPLFIDNNSTMHSKRPEWVCFDSIVRKTRKDGTTVATIQRVTPLDADWLATLCQGSNLMTLGSPLATPVPRYIKEKDSIQCAVETKFGGHGWEIPPCFVDMYDMIQKESKKTDQRKKQNSAAMQDDSFRWFARYLLEGKVLPELSGLSSLLNDEPAIITRRKPAKKVLMIVSALSDAGVDSAAALQKHWAEKDNKFLFKALKPWVKSNHVEEAKQLWIAAVTSNVDVWKNRG